MRAVRLINILTTLQAKGLVTAEALAAENCISVRTITATSMRCRSPVFPSTASVARRAVTACSTAIVCV